MLETGMGLDTGLPGPVVLRALTTADAVAFADHVAGDLPRLAEHLPWPEPTSTPGGAAGWLGLYERHEDGRVVVGGVWAGEALVGGALLFHHQPEDGIVEIGCWLTGRVACDHGQHAVASAGRAARLPARGHAALELRAPR